MLEAQFQGQCECGHCEQEHDCLSDGECLNTRCNCAAYRPRAPRTASIAPSDGSYTSEPIPGRQSAFHTTDARFWSSSEDARRAQQDLDALAALEADLTAAGDRAERLYRHRFALTPAGRAFVAGLRESIEITPRGRAALRQEVAR